MHPLCHLTTTRQLEKRWRGQVLSEHKATRHIATSADSSLLVPVLWDNVSLSFFSLQRLFSRLTKSTPSYSSHRLSAYSISVSCSFFFLCSTLTSQSLNFRRVGLLLMAYYCVGAWNVWCSGSLFSWVNEWMREQTKLWQTLYSLREHCKDFQVIHPFLSPTIAKTSHWIRLRDTPATPDPRILCGIHGAVHVHLP